MFIARNEIETQLCGEERQSLASRPFATPLFRTEPEDGQVGGWQ